MFIHTPMFVHPPVCLYAPLYVCMPPICLYAPRGVHPPGPPCFYAPAWFWHIACCGGLFFCFKCIGTHHPYLGVPPPLLHPPHSIVGSLCIVILRDISSYVGLSPSIEGFGDVPPITGGGWGDTSVAVHMLILLHLFL